MKKINKKYSENWDKVFGPEAKLKEQELQKLLLEKEHLYAIELAKKEELRLQKEKLEQQQLRKKEIKVKLKKIL